MTPAGADPAVALRRAAADDWPYTRRALPWILAGFLALLWLVPINGSVLRVHLPIEATIDRVALIAVAFLWIVLGGDRRRAGRRPAWFLGAVGTFIALAFVSLLVNAPRVVRLGELDLAQKKLALLLAFGLFAWFAISAMRPSELRAFSVLTVWLASLCALGVIVERRTGFNVFYEVSRTILHPIATVAATPTMIHPDPTKFDRPQIVGPTEHGLAVTTMLSMALPFAIVGLMDARNLTRKAAYAAAATLILAAALSTERKTGVVVPAVVLLFLAIYRTRDLLRLWPLALVLAAAIHVAAPGALGTINELGGGTLQTDSSIGRTSDYVAITPDFVTRPLLGFGFGSLDVAKPDTYRILDNEYLGQLLQVGLIGAAAYLAVIAAAIALAHRAIRSGDPQRAGPALAAGAAAAGYAVASALFDVLSFPQTPYVFLFMGALCTVASTGLAPRRARRRRLAGAPTASSP